MSLEADRSSSNDLPKEHDRLRSGQFGLRQVFTWTAAAAVCLAFVRVSIPGLGSGMAYAASLGGLAHLQWAMLQATARQFSPWRSARLGFHCLASIQAGALFGALLLAGEAHGAAALAVPWFGAMFGGAFAAWGLFVAGAAVAIFWLCCQRLELSHAIRSMGATALAGFCSTLTLDLSNCVVPATIFGAGYGFCAGRLIDRELARKWIDGKAAASTRQTRQPSRSICVLKFRSEPVQHQAKPSIGE